MALLLAIIRFLSGLFLPAADGGPSVFDTILVTILGLWADVAPTAAKMGTFIDTIPA
ncbi:MAG: hypothetical protein JSV16_08645 [Candidatus Hydrogenedentota bacterium]|nr:MAG: hypothetical protein JSV16_08645 [Candidatus Hydrogenedentota bacterium]